MGLVQKSVVYVFGRAVPALVGVGSVAIYTRMLDPASVGLYALLLSISLFAGPVGFSWLRVAALRLASGCTDDSIGKLLTTIAVSFVGTALTVGLVEAAVLRFMQPGLQISTILLTLAAAATSEWFDLNGTLLQARLSVVSWGLLNFTRAAAALVFSVILIMNGFKADALLGGFVLGNCAPIAFIRIWQPATRARFDRSLFMRLFMLGWPSSATAAFTSLSPLFQRYMIAVGAGSSAVGLYSVSSGFSAQVMSSIVGAISLAGIPLAYKAKDLGGPGALKRQLLDNARLIFAIALPTTVGLVVLAGPISHVVFGERFRAGADVIMAIIALSSLIASFRVYYFDQAFELSLETRPQAVISCIGTFILIVLSVVLVPRIAAVGAAISSLVAGALWLLMSIVWARRILPMPIPIRSWIKTTLAVAGMAVVIEMMQVRDDAFGLATGIAAGATTYAFLSVVMRLRLIRSRFPRRFAWLQR